MRVTLSEIVPFPRAVAAMDPRRDAAAAIARSVARALVPSPYRV